MSKKGSPSSQSNLTPIPIDLHVHTERAAEERGEKEVVIPLKVDNPDPQTLKFLELSQDRKVLGLKGSLFRWRISLGARSSKAEEELKEIAQNHQVA